ncbi:hypothetical protein ACTXT7_011783 [Hymenolepis weldensis]
MGTERVDDKPVSEEEVLSRETRDAKEVGGSENKTTSMSNPAQPLGKLLTLGYTGHSVTFRNRYMFTVPGLYEEIPSPENATAFVLNITFLEPFVCRYWFKSDKATARIKISQLIPSTKQTTGGVNSVDKVQFDNSNYMLVGISKDGYPNQIQPLKKMSTNKDICSRGGFYIGDFNVLDMLVVKTIGASGQFHHEFAIPNPPFRYYYKNPESNSSDFHILPRDYNTHTFMGGKCPRFQPPGPDNQVIILQMPFQKSLGESSEVIFLHGNVVIETELEVTFHSVPDHIAPEDKEVYIDDNSIDLLDYKGAEGKQLNPMNCVCACVISDDEQSNINTETFAQEEGEPEAPPEPYPRGPPLHTAIQTKPVINYRLPTGILRPANTSITYPTRKYTPAEQWARHKEANELFMQLRNEKENLKAFGEQVARAVHLNQNKTQLTVNEIKWNLHRYTTRRPHTRSETATGRRSDLLKLPLDKKSANYEPLMQAIRKWQDNLRNYKEKYNKFEKLKLTMISINGGLNKVFPYIIIITCTQIAYGTPSSSWLITVPGGGGGGRTRCTLIG